MNKEKLKDLEKYVQFMKNRLDSSIPDKHSGHPNEYRTFLIREIERAQSTIDAAKLEGVSK